MTDLPLSALFRRALTTADKANNMSTIQDETQELIQSALSDLGAVYSRLQTLSLFSPNELLADISTRDLVYLLVPFICAEVEGRVRTIDRDERMDRIHHALAYLRTFLFHMETYGVVPEMEKVLYAQQSNSVNDPAKRREIKIKQYQKEKELRTKIETVRKRRHQTISDDEPSSDFALIASLLPNSNTAAPDTDEEGDSDTEDILREATLLLLRLTYAQAHAQLQSLDQEIELLRSAPPPPPPPSSVDPRRANNSSQDDAWRLDAPVPRGGPDGKGPLLDSEGKPLRPFTILPSSMSQREDLRAQVFRPDHRLPSMSIDEYLEIEQQRGNIINGGGPQSADAPTSSEQLAMDAEADGTRFGEEKTEEKRQKDENWARYADANPRGAGNTMNRG